MQTSGKQVVFTGKFATGMQASKDQLDTRHALLGMHIDGHATSVIGHFQSVVRMQDHR